MDIPAAQFKAECLKLMDEVEKTRQPIVITTSAIIARWIDVPDHRHAMIDGCS